MNARHLANLIAAAEAHYNGLTFDEKGNAGDLFWALNVGKADLAEVAIDVAMTPAIPMNDGNA